MILLTRLNVCFISYEFPPKVGGEGSYSYGLWDAISKRHTVNMITMNGITEQNVINVSNIDRFPLKMYSFKRNAKKKFIDIHRDINVLHLTNDYFDIDIKKDVTIPVVATIHHPYYTEHRIFKEEFGMRSDYWKYLVQRRIHYLKYISKKICGHVDHIITVSNYTANEIMLECNIPHEKITVIPNAVDTNRFNPLNDGTVMRSRMGLFHEPIILYVGRLDETKGIKYLLEAFSMVLRDIPESKLILVGDGPLKKYIHSYISKNNLHDSILPCGKLPDADLPLMYAASDIVVLPSLIEGFGIVLLEAMATAKPCIAARCGGVEDVICEQQSGLLVPSRDVTAFYHAMYQLLSDKELARRFGLRGLEEVKSRFTWDIVARSTEQVYEQVLSEVDV